jgi:hypothetical protein
MAKLPLRFRVRSLLIAVASVGVVLGGLAELQRRRERFQEMAADHARYNPLYWSPVHVDRPFPNYRQGLWHAEMQKKYDRAASQPWLPVALDPPMPPPDPPSHRAFDRDTSVASPRKTGRSPEDEVFNAYSEFG